MGHCQPNSKNIPCGCIHQQVISLRVAVYIPLGHFHIIGVSFIIYGALSSWLNLSEVGLGWLLTLKAFKRMTRGWSGQGPSPSRRNKSTQFMQKSPLNALYINEYASCYCFTMVHCFYSPLCHYGGPVPIHLPPCLSDPSNLLFRNNTQRKSQILFLLECSQFERIQGATEKRKYSDWRK